MNCPENPVNKGLGQLLCIFTPTAQTRVLESVRYLSNAHRVLSI